MLAETYTDGTLEFNNEQTALFLGISTSRVAEYVKKYPDFPTPRIAEEAYKGRGYKPVRYRADEIAAWATRHGLKYDAIQELANRAWAEERREGGYNPFIIAFILAGGDKRWLAAHLGVHPQKLYTNKVEPLPEERIKELYIYAAAQVLYKGAELTSLLKLDPKLAGDDGIKAALYNLNHAHKIIFGSTLLDYLLGKAAEAGQLDAFLGKGGA